jgi:carbonic anhydrase/acetyltransferase-like protein (isoleucine patch superfamily)
MPGVEDGFPTIIGDDVLVGHNVMLHGCILHDRAFVGLSSTVMNGAIIEGDAMLAAGAMLTQGKRIAARQLWAGSPARFVRDLDDAAVMGMRIGVGHYVTNAKLHAAAVAEA